MKKIFLNRNAFNSPWFELSEIGLISIDCNGDLHGKRGLSSHPKWDGRWEGYYYDNSSIMLTEKGLELLKKSSSKVFYYLS